jgi:hypothetical protein
MKVQHKNKTFFIQMPLNIILRHETIFIPNKFSGTCCFASDLSKMTSIEQEKKYRYFHRLYHRKEKSVQQIKKVAILSLNAQDYALLAQDGIMIIRLGINTNQLVGVNNW